MSLYPSCWVWTGTGILSTVEPEDLRKTFLGSNSIQLPLEAYGFLASKDALTRRLVKFIKKLRPCEERRSFNYGPAIVLEGGKGGILMRKCRATALTRNSNPPWDHHRALGSLAVR